MKSNALRDYLRTDLACESGRACLASEEASYVVGSAPVTVVRRREEDGGHSVTVSMGRITARGEGELASLAEVLSREMRELTEVMLGRPPAPDLRVLVAGLGNADMTPDAIGPGTLRRLTVTRHLKAYNAALFEALGCCELSAIAPGVMGQTGMESGETVKAAVELTRPHLLIVVDALAARSCDRLSSTVQLSDSGISPGAGIGNHRMGINRDSMGCPVMGVGVPTVVDSATLVQDALAEAGVDVNALPPAMEQVLESGRQFIVSPRDCDEMVELTCRLLALSLDLSFGVGSL